MITPDAMASMIPMPSESLGCPSRPTPTLQVVRSAISGSFKNRLVWSWLGPEGRSEGRITRLDAVVGLESLSRHSVVAIVVYCLDSLAIMAQPSSVERIRRAFPQHWPTPRMAGTGLIPADSAIGVDCNAVYLQSIRHAARDVQLNFGAG